MDGAKRTAEISERTTSQFIDNNNNNNNNNSQNDSEIPAGVSIPPLGSNNHNILSMLLPPSPLHFKPFSYMPFSYSNESSDSLSPAIGSSVNQQPNTQGSDITLSSFENNASSGTEGSHSKIIGLKDCDGEEFPSSNEWDYHKDDGRNTEYSYLSMSDSPHQHRAAMTVGSSSSAGNVPSEMEDIEFGGKIVPANAVELTPNMNSTHTGESETALTAPPSLEDSDVPQVDRPSYVCRDLNITDYLAQRRAQVASIANPSLRAFMEAQLVTQTFYLLNNNAVAIQNYNSLPLEDEDNADDADETEDDEEEETEDMTNEEPILEGEQEAIVDDGLDEEAIVEALRTEKYISSTSTMACGCTVCWEQYKDGEDLGILDCDSKHKFHYKCIKRWLMRQNSCPLCRMNGLIL